MNTKHQTFFSILLLSFLIFGMDAYSQTVRLPYDPTPAKVRDYPKLDTSLVRVKYRMVYVKDVENPDKKTENTMMLQIGNELSKYFDYSRFISDSLYNVLAEKKTAKSEVSTQVINQQLGSLPLEIFKNYPKGKITTIDRVPLETYTFEEDMESPDWTLESDTLIVCGYTCKKATTTYFGRNYTAWHAPEIPISEGPWKFFRLPGLILKVEDDREHYSFECISIEKPTWGSTIYTGTSKPFGITKERFYKLLKEFNDNPAAMVEGTGLVLSPLPESARRARPYNPIELSE